jgi:hypothetical protein
MRTHSRYGPEVCPFSHEDRDGRAILEKGVVASARRGGGRPIHLSPEQSLSVEEPLTHIALEFRHQRGWGGEDAGSQ